MEQGFLTACYLAAGVLFILSLGGLSSQETARRGNLYGMVGMALAIAITFLHHRIDGGYTLIVGSVGVGAVIGTLLAARVAMTSMPELVAILHSFVGLAAVLVGISTYLNPGDHALDVVLMIEIWLDVAIGAITFTGSVIAWAKLRGSMSGKPLLLPGRHALNAVMLLGILGMLVPFWMAGSAGLMWLVGMSVLAGVLGAHLVMAIGGADMPVVVSLLNSYSGWAAAAAGFMLQNDLLIVTGALVGSSGAILSYIMCQAMNRSIWNVVFGGFGTDGGAPAKVPEGTPGEVVATNADEVVGLAKKARRIVVVPGYGMAVAQAQHGVREFGAKLKELGVEVEYAIHPVAGRLPGHMNVLLAEAGVPYDIVHEMEEVNPDIHRADLVLVIGANDIVNPGALDDTSSPIYGMPVIEAWKAGTVVVFKRSMNVGYAGVANPLFFKDNTRMLFGDAKASMDALLGALRG